MFTKGLLEQLHRHAIFKKTDGGSTTSSAATTKNSAPPRVAHAHTYTHTPTRNEHTPLRSQTRPLQPQIHQKHKVPGTWCSVYKGSAWALVIGILTLKVSFYLACLLIRTMAALAEHEFDIGEVQNQGNAKCCTKKAIIYLSANN